MRELYGKEGALLENHIFEFDFLNDEFFDIVDNRGKVLKKSPLPQSLQELLRKLQESAKNSLVNGTNQKSPSLANGDTKSESGDTLSPPSVRRGFASQGLQPVEWGVGEKTTISNETQNTEKSHRPLAPYMKEFSRVMRKNPTDAENKLWQELRNKKLGFSFRRQFVIDSKYIADFVCLEKRLIIECDGSQHAINDEQKSPHNLQNMDTKNPPPLKAEIYTTSPTPLQRGLGVGILKEKYPLPFLCPKFRSKD